MPQNKASTPSDTFVFVSLNAQVGLQLPNRGQVIFPLRISDHVQVDWKLDWE